ncbi:MAG TPA: hypothetical protein VN859_06135 [Steroidobacteraceae bacterium]|nr:hypothetical protein [Steroidobacteraceae bacterium]
MYTRTLLRASAILGGTLLAAGCGSDAMGPAASGLTQQSQTLDAAQVLSVAQVPTESADPTAVDGGALVVADAEDQTSDPMPVG